MMLRREPTHRNSNGLSVELAEFLRSLVPGRTVAGKYSHDAKWHELLLLAPTGSASRDQYQSLWTVMNPDQAVLEVAFDCSDAVNSVSKAFILPDDCRTPAELRGKLYRFATYPLDEQVVEKSVSVIKDALKQKHFVDVPEYRINMSAERVPFPKELLDEPDAQIVSAGQGPPRRDPDAPPTPRPAHTPAGHVWLAADPVPGLVELGVEVTSPLADSVYGAVRGWKVASDGTLYSVHLVKIEEATDFAAVRRRLFGHPDPAPAPVSAPPGIDGDARKGAGAALEGVDVRTLPVDYDDQGERWKDYKKAIGEMTVEVYGDSPVEGPVTAVSLLKHMWKHGGNPRLWLDVFMREKNLAANDRVVHELRVLLDAIYFLACYDQLNAGALACAEVLCRRISAIVDAYAVAGRPPNWAMAAYYTGQKSAADGVSPSLRNYVARLARDDREVQNEITRSTRLLPAGEDGGGESSGGRGAGGAQGRGTAGQPPRRPPKGRGRGLAPAVPP